MGGVSAQNGNASSELSADSSQIDIGINYEFSGDHEKITPTFNVVNNTVISQDYNSSSKVYNVKINSSELLNKLNVSVSAPGYISQYKIVDVNDASPINIDMVACDSYKLGYEITAKADSLLNFRNADKVLATARPKSLWQ